MNYLKDVDKKIVSSCIVGGIMNYLQNKNLSKACINAAKHGVTTYMGKWVNTQTGPFGTTPNSEILCTTVSSAIVAAFSHANILHSAEEAALVNAISEFVQHRFGIGGSDPNIPMEGPRGAQFPDL